jgi:hypothetical protein
MIVERRRPRLRNFGFTLSLKLALDAKVMALTLVFPWMPFSESW